MTYVNKTTGERYTGGSITRNINEHTVFTGVPTEELLTEWGFEPYVPPTHIPTEDEIREQRMQEILNELAETDYLALKAFEGEDMSEHPGWKEHRAELRAEYRELEAQLEADENEDENEDDEQEPT